MSTVKQGRLEPLDALRGIAAIQVLVVHLWWSGKESVFALGPTTLHFVQFGSTGVILFFVISGFSLDLTMPTHLRHARPLVSYFLSRFFRIAPLFYLMIPVTVLCHMGFGRHTPHALSILALNVSFLFNLFPGLQNGIVWASWTIGVEMIFYVLFPIFYRLPLWLIGGITIAVYAALLVAFGPLYFGDFGYFIFPTFLPLFVFGMATHRVFAVLRKHKPSLGIAIFAAGLLFIIALAIIYTEKNNIYLRIPLGIAYSSLLLGALLTRPLLLNNKVVCFYGSLSYAMYLLQFPVLIAIAPVFRRTLGGLSPYLAFAIGFPSALAIMTALSAAVYYFYERPFDRFRSRLVVQIGGRAEPADLLPSVGIKS